MQGAVERAVAAVAVAVIVVVHWWRRVVVVVAVVLGRLVVVGLGASEPSIRP